MDIPVHLGENRVSLKGQGVEHKKHTICFNINQVTCSGGCSVGMEGSVYVLNVV
jgi:hypothetical protein